MIKTGLKLVGSPLKVLKLFVGQISCHLQVAEDDAKEDDGGTPEALCHLEFCHAVTWSFISDFALKRLSMGFKARQVHILCRVYPMRELRQRIRWNGEPKGKDRCLQQGPIHSLGNKHLTPFVSSHCARFLWKLISSLVSSFILTLLKTKISNHQITMGSSLFGKVSCYVTCYNPAFSPNYWAFASIITHHKGSRPPIL